MDVSSFQPTSAAAILARKNGSSESGLRTRLTLEHVHEYSHFSRIFACTRYWSRKFFNLGYSSIQGYKGLTYITERFSILMFMCVSNNSSGGMI